MELEVGTTSNATMSNISWLEQDAPAPVKLSVYANGVLPEFSDTMLLLQI